MTWQTISPWLGLLGIAATLGGVLWPYFRAKDRDARDASAIATATMQSHRIGSLEGERNDLKSERDDLLRRVASLEAKNADYLEVIERAIRHER